MLVRSPGDSHWHVPIAKPYENECDLQTLIELSPEVLPGSSDSFLLVMREVSVETGWIDLVCVSDAGDITLVECKLAENAEMRRTVVGQVLAYASAVWGLSYVDFDRRCSEGGMSLAERMSALAGNDWDEAAFREAISRRLELGHYRLVIAVDAITEELKGIVRFLNRHTIPELEVLALELQRANQDGFEILVPALYGDESKVGGTPHIWDKETVFEALASFCTEAGSAATRTLYDSLEPLAAGFTWGKSEKPYVSMRLPVCGNAVLLVSFDGATAGHSRIYLNIGNLAPLVSSDVTNQFLSALRTNADLESLLVGIDEDHYNKYPSVQVDTVLPKSGVVDTIISAIRELIETRPPV